MTDEDAPDEVRTGYAAREQERPWLATPKRDEWIVEDDKQTEVDDREARERMRRRIEAEYNRNRFGIEDDDRVGRVWGGEDDPDDPDNQPTGVIRTAPSDDDITGELPPVRYGRRARIARDFSP